MEVQAAELSLDWTAGGGDPHVILAVATLAFLRGAFASMRG
jgi:hypothetical protein